MNAYVSSDSRSSFVPSAERSRSLKHTGFSISVSSPGFEDASVASTTNPSPHANSRSSRPGAKATHVALVVSFNTWKRVLFATGNPPRGFPCFNTGKGTSHTSSEAV